MRSPRILIAVVALAGLLVSVSGCTAAAPPKSLDPVFTAAGVDWPAAGNRDNDQSLTDAAMNKWAVATGDTYTANHLLFAGEDNITYLTDGECGIIVIAAAVGSQVQVGFFVSTGPLTTANIVYVGQSAPDPHAATILTNMACPSGQPHSAIPITPGVPDPNPPSGQSHQIIALASPGNEIKGPQSIDTGSLAPAPEQGRIMSDGSVTTNSVAYVVTAAPDSRLVETITIPYTAPPV